MSPIKFVEFAKIPNVGEAAPRMRMLVDETATHRLFVHLMTGPIYSVSYDGKTITEFLDVNAPQLGSYVDADNLPQGGQDAMRRIPFDDKGTTKTLLELIQEKNVSQGKPPAK